MDVTGLSILTLTVLLVPLVEEFLIRGHLMNAVGKAYGAKAALLLTSLVFVALHMFHSVTPKDIVLLFLAGLGYGVIRLWTGNWKIAWYAHVLLNYFIMLPKWYVAGLHFWIVPKLLNGNPP